MASPAHINLIAEEVSDEVAKEAESTSTYTLSKKQWAQKASRARKGTVAVGGGI